MYRINEHNSFLSGRQLPGNDSNLLSVSVNLFKITSNNIHYDTGYGNDDKKGMPSSWN